MPFNIGPGELIIVLIIALIVVGPGKLPDVGAALGKSIREFRRASADIKESTGLETVAPAAPAPAPTAAPVAAAPAPAAPAAAPDPAPAAPAAAPDPAPAAPSPAPAPVAAAPNTLSGAAAPNALSGESVATADAHEQPGA